MIIDTITSIKQNAMNNQPTVQEMNRVIAEYDNRIIYGHPFVDFLDGKNAIPECISKYATSYDWLMPVAKKAYEEFCMMHRDNGFIHEPITAVRLMRYSFGDIEKFHQFLYRVILDIKKIKGSVDLLE